MSRIFIIYKFCFLCSVALLDDPFVHGAGAVSVKVQRTKDN